MTPTQRALARHALGLPNEMQRSYRNWYRVSLDSPDHHEWFQLGEQGDAISVIDNLTLFYQLTHAGALAAIDEGEQLDPEDFQAKGA